MSTIPKISIVMPVLNRVDTVEKALLSVINQDYPQVELIVIDGASVDGTVDLIKRYEKYITYWHSEPDDSPADAANIGIQKATGDLVALLMADDWYEPDVLKKVGETFKTHPNVDVITCGGRILQFDENKKKYIVKHAYHTEKEMALNFTNICFDITSAICCRFIRKSFYDRIGLFDPYDKKGEYMLSNDKEFLMRAVLNNVKNIHIDEIGHNYLASQASSTFGNHKKNILRLCVEHMEIAEKYLKLPNLNLKQRCLLKYWYNDQSTRLVLYYLLDKHYRKAFSQACNGWQRYKLLWLPSFVVTVVRIMVKKAWRGCRGIIQRVLLSSRRYIH